MSAMLIMVEKHAPSQPSNLTMEDLPQNIKDWYKRGKMYKVNGRNMFAIKEGEFGFNLAKTCFWAICGSII